MQTVRLGPDFVSIGMPSSGTRWLYDVLQAHCDVRMPLIKELHFLDRGIREHSVRNRLRQVEQREKKNKPSDPRDRAFLDRYAQCEAFSELLDTEREFQQDFKRNSRIETPFLPRDRHFDF